MKVEKTNSNVHARSRTAPLKFPALLLLAIVAAVNLAPAQVPVFSNIWNVVSGTNAIGGLPNDLPSSGNNVRGIAINPVTTNILYASTASGTNGGNNHFTTLDYTNAGAFLGQGLGTGVGIGGTLALTQIRVSDDGYVYACSLSGAPASRFVLYRWPADSDFATAATVVYDSGSGTSFQWRAGDYMDLRGSGLNTEIVVTGNGSGANITTNFVIFRPTDETATLFTNFSITIPGGTVNRCGGGVTFEGTNDAIYVKAAGANPVYRVAYNTSTLTATITATFNTDQTANNGLKYFEVDGVKLLASVTTATTAVTNGAAHYAKIVQFNTPSNVVTRLSQPLPLPNQANGNSLGLVDFRNGVAVFSEPNNGIAVYQITGFITNTPPTISTLTGAGVYVEGYSPLTLTANVSGTAPLSYQWYYNTNTVISGATTNSLSLGAADLAESGTYQLIVTNLYGSATSSLASVTVLPGGYSSVATQIWTLAPGSRDYLTTTDTQRGMAYDAISKRLVLVSRAPTNGVHLLDAATGADLGDMDQSFSSSGSGTFQINMAAVADDGVVYVCNLTTATDSSAFYLYSWSGASNVLEGVTQGAGFFSTLPIGGRLGDTLTARGAGVNTEILAAFRTGTNIALFTTGDGVNFSFNQIAVTNLPADAIANGFAGLGIAFGSSNTFWAKSSGFQLRLVRYDVTAGTGEVIYTSANPPGSVGPIGVDPVNGILAGVGFGQIPQNLSLYDLQAEGQAALIDREHFAVNNANANGTGAVSFDVADGRLFALDSNSGIQALNYAPRLYITPQVNGGTVTWTGPGILQASPFVTGPYTNVPAAVSPYTNTGSSALFFRVQR